SRTISPRRTESTKSVARSTLGAAGFRLVRKMVSKMIAPAPMPAFTYRPVLGRGGRAMSTSYCPKHTSYHEPGGANAMSAKGLRPALPGGPELEACGCGMASTTSEQSSGGGGFSLGYCWGHALGCEL